MNDDSARRSYERCRDAHVAAVSLSYALAQATITTGPIHDRALAEVAAKFTALGERLRAMRDAYAAPDRRARPCVECGGDGFADTGSGDNAPEPCDGCGGAGVVSRCTALARVEPVESEPDYEIVEYDDPSEREPGTKFEHDVATHAALRVAGHFADGFYIASGRIAYDVARAIGADLRGDVPSPSYVDVRDFLRNFFPLTVAARVALYTTRPRIEANYAHSPRASVSL